MLLRLYLNNILSFGEPKEFSMFANSRLKTLTHHAKPISDKVSVLKMASIYGANGSGKSNLIKALAMLQDLVTEDITVSQVRTSKHKWAETEKQTFAIEFFAEEQALYYGLEINKTIIATEELYKSGLGTKPDELVFERKTTLKGETKIKFSNAFDKDPKIGLLREVLLQDFVKAGKPVLQLLSNRDNENLHFTKVAFKWLSETLTILGPDSKPAALPHILDISPKFKEYANDMIYSFKLGIAELTTKTRPYKEFSKDVNEETKLKIARALEDNSDPNFALELAGHKDTATVVRIGEDLVVKQLRLGHRGGKEGTVKEFSLDEESDGTIRLIDFIPAFQNIVSGDKVYVIDEIERSIHPTFIKELISKFSFDCKTNGQLIFTTHESNLLDQEIFRQDEIWFAEKNNLGSTDLYSLNDFKEHKTIDIKKGYLNGRYGSIPFMSDLKTLNWHMDDSAE